MRKIYSLLCLVIFSCFYMAARAEPDSFGLGTGRDGALTISTTNTVINSYAPVTASLSPGNLSISIGTITGAAAGFNAGDLVMVWQTTGLSPEPASGAAGPFDLSSDVVGRWEFARVASVSGSTLTLTAPLIYGYSANRTQVVKVPEFTSVTINSGKSITARSWDGTSGGIVVFLAQGTVTNNGSINAAAMGFRGGQYVDDLTGNTAATGLDEPAAQGAQKGEGLAFSRYGTTQTGRGNVANGAGGGVAYLSGGGGGGNAGAGGKGGNSDFAMDGNRAVGGMGGGSVTYSALTRLLMGGGGGAGHGANGSGVSGGNGGGVIFVRCGGWSAGGGSSIVARGGNPATTNYDGASGGGAGGTIYLRCTGTANFGTVSAAGGLGGNTNGLDVGPGGGGGGGNILLERCSGSAIVSSAGGLAGMQADASAPGGTSYGAISGNNGTTTTLATCMPLPATPVVTIPASGDLTGSTPVISGTGPASTDIVLYIDEAYMGTVTSNAGGNYSFSVTGPLADGSHTLKAYSTSEALYSTPVTLAFTTSSTLPVHLFSFTAVRKESTVVLQWLTSEEWNSRSFTIERSKDGSSFASLGTLKAGGSTNTTQAYSFTDLAPFSGMSFYRLKSTDLDGYFKYSHTLIVRYEGSRTFEVFPNPARDQVHIQLRAAPGPVTIRVVDASGREVLQKQLTSVGGSLSTTQDIRKLTPGLYFIKAGAEKLKLVKE
jgi:hypothetical protein